MGHVVRMPGMGGAGGIMDVGTSSTAITGAPGKLICVPISGGHQCHQEVAVAFSQLIIKTLADQIRKRG